MLKQIDFVRHGEYCKQSGALTSQEVEAALEARSSRNYDYDIVFSAPALRCRQTARILSGVKPNVLNWLGSSSPTLEIIRRNIGNLFFGFAGNASNILVVAHSDLIAIVQEYFKKGKMVSTDNLPVIPFLAGVRLKISISLEEVKF